MSDTDDEASQSDIWLSLTYFDDRFHCVVFDTQRLDDRIPSSIRSPRVASDLDSSGSRRYPEENLLASTSFGMLDEVIGVSLLHVSYGDADAAEDEDELQKQLVFFDLQDSRDGFEYGRCRGCRSTSVFNVCRLFPTVADDI